MPKINADVIAEYARKKKERDEKRKTGGEASMSQSVNIGPRISEPVPPPITSEVEASTPISIIHIEDLQPRKMARPSPGTSSAPLPSAHEPSNVFAGIENFEVADPMTALIAGNTATVLIRSLQRFSTAVGSKAIEEKEALWVEVGNLKKANSELRKTANDAAAAQKSAEEELGKVNTEIVRLNEEITKLRESLKLVESQKNELELKAAEDLSKAEKRIQDLGTELEEMTGECIEMYEEGYNQCISHVKFLHPDLDTSELSCT